MRPCQYRPSIELIRNFQKGLSCCFDRPCGAEMWSGCDVLAIAPANGLKQFFKGVLGASTFEVFEAEGYQLR